MRDIKEALSKKKSLSAPLLASLFTLILSTPAEEFTSLIGEVLTPPKANVVPIKKKKDS